MATDKIINPKEKQEVELSEELNSKGKPYKLKKISQGQATMWHMNNEEKVEYLQQRVRQMAKWIGEGKARATCIDMLMDKEQIQRRQATKAYNDALMYLCPDEDDNYRKGLIQKNFDRLEKIVEESWHMNPRVAISAISEMNKMLHVSETNIMINKNAQGDEQVVIKFG